MLLKRNLSHFGKVLITCLMTMFALLVISVAKAGQDGSQVEVLTSHNHWRSLHQAPKLVWDEQLANYALKYAQRCKFQHSSSPYGENLAAGYKSITAAVNAWYGEQKLYSYHNPGFSMKTGHFTQVVWKSSKKLGCGYVQCNTNGRKWDFLVCEYSPAGNIVNKNYFKANVLPA